MKMKERLAEIILQKFLKKKFGDELKLEIKKCDICLENDGRVSITFDGKGSLPVETVSSLLGVSMKGKNSNEV